MERIKQPEIEPTRNGPEVGRVDERPTNPVAAPPRTRQRKTGLGIYTDDITSDYQSAAQWQASQDPARAEQTSDGKTETPEARAVVPDDEGLISADNLDPARFDSKALAGPDSVQYAALLAQAAYLDAADFNSPETKTKFGFTETRFFDQSTNKNAKHAQAGIGVRPGVGIFIAYRGTEVMSWDTIRDLSATRTPAGDLGRDGKVHAGFAQQTRDLWLDISAEVRALIQANPGLPVYFTGHSLGGAVARLAAGRVMNSIDDGSVPEGSRIGGVYTFGAPAVGDEKYEQQWVDRMAQQGGAYVRVRNNHDPVPLVPAVNYHHAAPGPNVQDVHLQDGTMEPRNDLQANSRVSGALETMVEAPLGWLGMDVEAGPAARAVTRVGRAAGAAPFVTNHLMDNYLEGIDSWKSSTQPADETEKRS